MRGREREGERDGEIEIRTARHQTPAIRLVLKRRERDGKRSGLCARKERQDRWKRGEEQGARTKRRCQRDDETKQRENGFRTNTRPGTLASFERNYQAHARIGRVLFSFLFLLFLSDALALSLFRPYAPYVIYCNFITAYFRRIATTPYRSTLYEVAINLCFAATKSIYERSHAYSSNISNGLLLILKLDGPLIKLHCYTAVEQKAACLRVRLHAVSPSLYKVHRGKDYLAMRY